MTWKNISTSHCYIETSDQRYDDIINAAFGILAGRSDNNTLERLVCDEKPGGEYFVNDDCWWRYIDFQCNFHATYGWRPFCDSKLRDIDLTTWQMGFLRQVTREIQEILKQKYQLKDPPPQGWLAAGYSPDKKHYMHDSPTMYYANCIADSEQWAFQDDKAYPGHCLFSRFGEHDVNPDYPLMNCITATDWMLWERNSRVAEAYLPNIERFIESLNQKRDETGFFVFGTQGSQIEWGHAGRRRQTSTHLYGWKVLENMSQVYAMLGKQADARRCRQSADELREKLNTFWIPEGWFVSGVSEDFHTMYGSGRMDGNRSDYLEVWPNVNAAILGYLDAAQCRVLADRFESINPLVENHLTLSNYPARPSDELDPDHNGFPPPGIHLNGGFHWMHAGSALAMYARAGHPQTPLRLEELLEDHRQHLSVDYYNQWGQNKEKQWPDHPNEKHSVTCAGAFGHFFRNLFNLKVTADSLIISLPILKEIPDLKMHVPIRWGQKELYLSYIGSGNIHKAVLEGKELDVRDPQTIDLPFDRLNEKSILEIELR